MSNNPQPSDLSERSIRLRRDDHEMPTFVVHPREGDGFSAIIVLMDMWGMRWVLYDIARSIANAGYYCILPDLYYRWGEVRYAAQDIRDRPMSFTELEPERQVTLRNSMDSLSNQMVADDVASLLDFMRDEPVKQGPVGLVGYCMGGRYATYCAGSFPERIKAAACLHGAGLIDETDKSPHLMARHAQGEIYFGHAELDKYALPDVTDRIEASLAGCPVQFQQRIHAQTHHAYAMPDRDVYDAEATRQDWEAIFDMMHRQLG